MQGDGSECGCTCLVIECVRASLAQDKGAECGCMSKLQSLFELKPEHQEFKPNLVFGRGQGDKADGSIEWLSKYMNEHPEMFVMPQVHAALQRLHTCRNHVCVCFRLREGDSSPAPLKH